MRAWLIISETRHAMTPDRLFVVLGALNAAAAVVLGAFGSHALKTRLPADLLAVYQTGNLYHFFHALGLILIGLAAARWADSVLLRNSGWLMLAGIVLFSGSLYLLSFTGQRWLGAVTPFGGLAFIAAWLLLAVAAWRM
jgi:uncharacterized membrane protein YgdD (TMEM256/DUF423 family)